MARPKKAESIRRTSNVMVRFSSIEYELVAGYAKDAGYRRPILTSAYKSHTPAALVQVTGFQEFPDLCSFLSFAHQSSRSTRLVHQHCTD